MVRTARIVVAAAIIGLAAAAAGCGQQRAGSQAAASGAPTSSAPAAPVHCHGAAPTSPPRNTLLLGDGDNGKSWCVARGARVLVYLKGTRASKWAPIHASSSALAPKANGRLVLARGVTGASFVAVRPGLAVISSARPVCGGAVSAGAGGSSPGSAHCDAVLAFRVRVVVSR